MCVFCQSEFHSLPTSQTPSLAETEQQMLQDLMSEAMEETDGQPAVNTQQNGDDLKYDFFFLFFLH